MWSSGQGRHATIGIGSLFTIALFGLPHRSTAATAVFTPVGATAVLPGEPVTFDVALQTQQLVSFDAADVVIGSNGPADVAFTYSPAWTGAFSNTTAPVFDVGFYGQDVFLGGNNSTEVGASLALGTVVVDTTGMSGGLYTVKIDNAVDGVSRLALQGETEPIQGSGTFFVEGACEVPSAEALGCRYLGVTPFPGSAPVAILITGDVGDPDVSCVVKYVQAHCNGGTSGGLLCEADADCPGGVCENTGLLGDTAVYRTPAEWGTVAVRGGEVQPTKTYTIQADCGPMPGDSLSAPVIVTTRVWGDVVGNGLPITFADISLVVDAFRQLPGIPMESADLNGPNCTPQGAVNFQDISGAVDAFRSFAFDCPPPCP